MHEWNGGDKHDSNFQCLEHARHWPTFQLVGFLAATVIILHINMHALTPDQKHFHAS